MPIHDASQAISEGNLDKLSCTLMSELERFGYDTKRLTYPVDNVLASTINKAFCSMESSNTRESCDIKQLSDISNHMKHVLCAFKERVLFTLDCHALNFFWMTKGQQLINKWLFFRVIMHNTNDRLHAPIDYNLKILNMANRPHEPNFDFVFFDLFALLDEVENSFNFESILKAFYGEEFADKAHEIAKNYMFTSNDLSRLRRELLRSEVPIDMTNQVFSNLIDKLKRNEIDKFEIKEACRNTASIERPLRINLARETANLPGTSQNNATTQDQSDTRKRVSSGGNLLQPVQKTRLMPLTHSLESLQQVEMENNALSTKDQSGISSFAR